MKTICELMKQQSGFEFLVGWSVLFLEFPHFIFDIEGNLRLYLIRTLEIQELGQNSTSLQIRY